MIKTIILTLVVLFLPIFVFFACCPEVDSNFNIQGIECNALYNSPDGTGSLPRVTTELDTVPFNKHSININLKVDYYSNHSRQIFSNGAAYALSCDDPGYGGSPEGLDTLYLITKKALDKTHQANDTINDILLVSGYIYPTSSTMNDISLKEFISHNKSTVRDRSIVLRLSQEPEYKQESHSFTVVIRLGNGEQYMATTNEIRFQ